MDCRQPSAPIGKAPVITDGALTLAETAPSSKAMPPLLLKLISLLLYTVAMVVIVALIAGMRFAVERRRDEQAVQSSKDRLQFALDAGRLGRPADVRLRDRVGDRGIPTA
jgi:hypothetical protein